MENMENINLNEANLFSKNIIELKLLSDRMSEGKAEKIGIFSNMYQILYIVNRKDFVSPKEIISELNIAKSNLAILAKNMINDGLIESHKDSQNRREIFYNVTSLGKEVLQEKLEKIDEEYSERTKTALNVLNRAVAELKKIEKKKNKKSNKKL